ncbi:hypothetical protein ACUNWD_11390 [Sunxiuqinia sp. A32]|uniref:hypothetical protein n=1 Tax=Sunxiuqinia sp. A32 TaxID=3461496 RepID=UPI00404592E2
MEPKSDIEVFGTITKKEMVFSIDDKVKPGSLVFEAIKPFPGYYHETPFNNTKPLYMYLALQEHYPLEEIIRATEKVEGVFDEKFDAGKGFLNITSQTFNVLRVRHLNNYDQVGRLQEVYEKHGLKFISKQKKSYEDEAQIKVVKFFNMRPIAEGIYIDGKEEFHAYIEIPKYHEWGDFNELSNRVKYNWDGSSFDAAEGSFFHKGKMHEVVRIYSNKIDLDYLKGLRKLYFEKMK